MKGELYREITRNEKTRVAAFEGCAYTLDDFQRELEIYERLHRAWGLRFVQSVMAPSSTVWFAYEEINGATFVKGAVKAERFEGDISRAECVSFYWEPVRQGIMAAQALGVQLRLVAMSAGKLYSVLVPETTPNELWTVNVSVRPDKGGIDADQSALVLWVPRASLKLVREP